MNLFFWLRHKIQFTFLFLFFLTDSSTVFSRPLADTASNAGGFSVFPVESYAVFKPASVYDPTEDLLSVFGNRCESVHGRFSNEALAYSGQMMGIIESLRDDPECRGIGTALLPIESLIASQVKRPTLGEIELRRLRAEAHDLEILLASESSRPEPDIAFLERIKDHLYNKKLEIVTEQSRIKSERDHARVHTIDNFRIYTNSLISLLGQNLDCLERHPGLLAQIGSQILATSSSLVAGATGSALLATGAIMDSFVGFLRNLKYSKYIRELRGERLSYAVNCAIEGLATTYCQARDVQSVVRFNVQHRSRPDPADLTWMGLELVSTELPAFNTWVNRINAGSVVSGEAQASERKKARELELDLQNRQYDLQAEISRTERKVGSTGGSESERETLTDRISNIISGGIVRGSHTSTGYVETPGPFQASFASDRSCGPITFLYTGGAERTCNTDDRDFENCKKCAKERAKGAIPTLSSLKGSIAMLISEATDFVSSEVSLVQENNPQIVLTGYQSQTANRKSAKDFVLGATTYLNFLLAKPEAKGPGPLRVTLEKAKARFERVEEIVSNPTPKAEDDVTELAKLLVPQGDVFYVASEFREIVKQFLDLKVDNGSLDERLATILQLTSSESLSALVENSFGLEAIMPQTRNAQTLSRKTLSVLSDLFAENIVQGITSIDAKNYPTQIDYEDELALYCVRSLLIPGSPFVNGIDLRKYCKGRIYYSLYPLSQNFVSYDSHSNPEKPFPQRACLLYDFLRRSRVYELSLRASRGTQ